MIRLIVSIIAGYAIFVATSLTFFKLSGHNPHANPTSLFIITTAFCGVVFSFTSGFVTKLIAKTANLKVNYVLAFIIIGFATFSYFKSTGNHWTQIMAIFIFGPVSVLGGLYYQKLLHKY